MVEKVNTYEAPKAEDPAYIDEMVKKTEGATAEADEISQEDRPEWLPEKFQSAEDLAKAYSELESKLGTTPEETSEVENVEEAAREVVENAGMDFEAMSSEFWENQTLSDDTYDKLNNAGIPSHIVDAFIDGQMAVADKARNDAFATVGGEQNYNEMVEWAVNNLNEQEVRAYNAAVESGDPNATKLAISGLNAQYRMDNGQEPNLISGEAKAASSGSYQSVAELTAAMSDPRYQRDSAYRKSVSDKLSRSSVL